MYVLDHVFILCAKGAPEAASLTRAGLTEGSPNTHPGQGTACRRFFLRNVYLELVWVSDEAEAQGPDVHRTRLFERWAKRGSGASPFGVVLRPGGAGATVPPFPSWKYTPAYLPLGLALEVALGTHLSEPELFYFGVPRRQEDMQEQPRGHRAPLDDEVTSASISIPSPPTAALRAVEAAGLVCFPPAAEPLLTLRFGTSTSESGSLDMRPGLPLLLRW
jgi:hypothetical protein